MRISLNGFDENGRFNKVVYNLYDEYCHKTNTSSMARTTGYTATAAVHLILNNLFNEKGVFPPELVGKHENCFNFIFDYLKERNVHYSKTEI
jgi:saccharopine dehydrogenase-like NADP-dependent oxidoreductase